MSRRSLHIVVNPSFAADKRVERRQIKIDLFQISDTNGLRFQGMKPWLIGLRGLLEPERCSHSGDSSDSGHKRKKDKCISFPLVHLLGVRKKHTAPMTISKALVCIIPTPVTREFDRFKTQAIFAL